MTSQRSPRFFASAAAFRRWLDKYHSVRSELLVGFYKEASGRGGLRYTDSLDEALCFGWIDGVRRRIDADAYSVRFARRRAASVWSAASIRRVRALIRLGRMKPAGTRAFRQRDEEKTRRLRHQRRYSHLDASLSALLRSNKKAASFFDGQPPSYRSVVTFWIMSARKEETRMRRLVCLIEYSARKTRLDLLNPYGR